MPIRIGQPVESYNDATELRSKWETEEVKGHYQIQGETGKGFQVIWSDHPFPAPPAPKPAPPPPPVIQILEYHDYCAFCLDPIFPNVIRSVWRGVIFCNTECAQEFAKQVFEKESKKRQ